MKFIYDLLTEMVVTGGLGFILGSAVLKKCKEKTHTIIANTILVLIALLVVINILDLPEKIFSTNVNEDLSRSAEAIVDTVDQFQDKNISLFEARNVVEIWANACSDYNGYIYSNEVVINAEEQNLKKIVKDLQIQIDSLSYDYGGGNEFGGSDIYFDDLEYDAYSPIFNCRNEIADILQLPIRSDY
ncbi:MAG: hypothetical protein IKK09_01475 [Clostridia bacterium]|nr:hypothetical protein [Clostridia bacterium]